MQRLKHINLVLVIMFVAAVLAACGSGSGNSGQSAETAKPAESAAAGSGETMIYKAANGDIQVPKNPQRVVLLAGSYVGDFLALGIKPAGITEDALKNPYYSDKVQGIESLGDGSSVEKVLALKPDLIIVYSAMENIDKFEKIAPTVAIEYGTKTFKEQLIDFGVMTGNEAKAKEWVDNWNKKIAEYKPQIEAVVGTKTVSILNPYAKGIYVYGHNYARGGEILYGEFGLKAPAAAQKEAIDSGTGWASITLEKLPEYAGDYIFTSPWSGDTSDPKQVYDNPLWKELPAVKNNHVFQMHPDGAYFNDAISMEAHLQFIVDNLLGKK